MKREIEGRLEKSSAKLGRAAFMGVFGFTMLMITREGMETALLMTQLIFTVKSTQVVAGAAAEQSARGVSPALVALRLPRQPVTVLPGDGGVPARLRCATAHLRIPRAHRSQHLPEQQPLHDATEAYGPDGIYGQYMTYLLVLLRWRGWPLHTSSTESVETPVRSST